MSVVFHLIIISVQFCYTDECRPIGCFDKQTMCVFVCLWCLLIIRSRGNNHTLNSTEIIFQNSDSESFWLQDPFILLKIIENSKELCLSLLLFTVLENKTEKLKIQAHTIIVANSISPQCYDTTHRVSEESHCALRTA